MDELVKRLRELHPEEFGDAWDFAFACQQTMHEAADAIEELSKPRWIPVTERLPEVGVWVLCYCRANSFDVFRMTDEGHWQYGNRSIYMKGYVTHWMPLPEPPKEET